METEQKTPGLNTDLKANIAILLSIAALAVSLFGGGGLLKPSVPDGPEGFIKQTAKDAGIGGRTYDQCIEDTTIEPLILEDVNETNAIASFAEMAGIGTPFNVIVTDRQVIPVSGAYPYELFELILNTIEEQGSIDQETLAQFEITELDYEVVRLFRPFDPVTDHYRGSGSPSITIIEYSDLECPFCARVHDTFKQIVDEHTDVTWVYRHLPLSFHPQAMPAAIASECVAREEGNEAFWNFADTIFANQEQLQ